MSVDIRRCGLSVVLGSLRGVRRPDDAENSGGRDHRTGRQVRICAGAGACLRRRDRRDRTARHPPDRPVEPLARRRSDGASGWTSRYPTRLVNAATGAAVSGFNYDSTTGALRYAGTFKGDVTVRLERTDASIRSNDFRLRALAPTYVYGDNAASVIAKRGWQAQACEPPMSFADCRRTFTGGREDDDPLVVFVTPGSYTGDFWISSGRRFVYFLGDPASWPTLSGDSIAISSYELAQVRNFKLRSTRIGSGSNRKDSPRRWCCRISISVAKPGTISTASGTRAD